jgi:hypothetical protein
MRAIFMLILLELTVACAQETPPPLPAPAAARAAFIAGDPPAAPAARAGSNGALGSGCAPGAGSLPDGAWFGFARAWDASGIEFDLACFYVGEAAAAQASARNDESPPPNDYYIVNDAAATRRLSVSADIVAHRLILSGGSVGLERTSYADLIANPSPDGVALCPGEHCLIWVFINGGRATEVLQQFTP